jgi:hypothetical protein
MRSFVRYGYCIVASRPEESWRPRHCSLTVFESAIAKTLTWIENDL